VFQKGELLYGLHVAFSRIRESGRVVIVEGYTDVLALIKHGFRGAVATLGTALTRDPHPEAQGVMPGKRGGVRLGRRRNRGPP